MLNHNYLYDTNNNKKVITVSVQLCWQLHYYKVFLYNNILVVCYVSAVFVEGNFRRHIELKLSCYIIVYLQTAGVKYCY